MIGTGLRKLANENGMTVAGGVAYGDFRGYAVTFSEGAGYKLMAIATRFSGEQELDLLESRLNEHNLMKEFRVQNISLMLDGILVEFFDNPGTIKRMLIFCDWFFPLLRQTSATGSDCCCECGQPLMGDETWKLSDGLALHMHKGCARSLLQKTRQQEEKEKEEAGGSYGRGLLGALLGGLIGAVAWAVVLFLGYMAALVGLLIGWLAEVFYRKLGGKNGRGKLPILLLAALVGVFVGTLGADVFTLVQMIGAGELPAGYGDIFRIIGAMLVTDGEYLRLTLMNVGLGMVFALLGMLGVLYKTHKETKSFKMKDLE